jgi:hypothetical protein
MNKEIKDRDPEEKIARIIKLETGFGKTSVMIPFTILNHMNN